MISWLSNFFKTQKANMLFLLFVFLFSTYFNYVNSLNRQHLLIAEKITDIHRLLDFQLIFMKRMLQDVNQTSSYKRQSISLLIHNIKHKSDNKDPLGYASNWLTFFNKYLLNHDLDSLKDYSSMKNSYESLLSSIIRYNLEVKRYNRLVSSKPLRFLSSFFTLTNYRIVSNPILTITAFEIVE